MTDDVTLFEQAVKRNHLNFADWAGADDAGMGDRDVVGNAVYPDGGDMVLFDTRGRAGFIGIHHDNWSDIHLVKIKKAADKGYNLRLKKIPRRVPTMDLIKRYLWISNIFLDWLHVSGASPFMIWKTSEDIEKAFRAEAEDFEGDPHLALYWLMHFGLCNDPRYAEVARIVRTHGHDRTMDKMRITLAFFDTTNIDHDIDLTPRYNPQNKDYTQLFLRRRANLLYETYGQSFRGDGVLEPVWQSVSLYRRVDEYAILRIRWLKNNLAKYNLWDAAHAHLNDTANDDIPFITYPRIFQTNRSETSMLADMLVTELLDTRQIWANRYSEFGKAILHDTRDHISDQAAFRSAALVIFDGDLGEPRFADILASIGEAGFGDEATREKLATYEAIFADSRNLLVDSLDKLDTLFAQADALLSGLNRAEMTFFVGACTHSEARRVILRHVLLHDTRDREDHIVSLFPRAAFADHKLKDFFGDDHPALITASDDTVARAMYRVLDLPEAAFKAKHLRKKAAKSVCDLIRNVAHEPPAFERITDIIDGDEAGVVSGQILKHLFKQPRGADTHPIAQLNTAKVVRLMTVAMKHAHREPPPFRTGLRCVVECTEFCHEAVSDPQAPHFKQLMAFLDTPADVFTRPLDRKEMIETIFGAIRPAAATPAVFDMLIGLIETDTSGGISQGIFSAIFSDNDYDDRPSPIRSLSDDQIMRVLQTALAHLERCPENPKPVMRTFTACAVPAAKDWFKRTRADAALMERLEPHRVNYRSLAQRLEDTLDDALADIAEDEN